MLPDVMNVTEAAGYLRVSEETLADLAERGQIPARKLNDEWRFLRRAIDVWLFAHKGIPEGLYAVPWTPELEPSILTATIRDMVLAELTKSGFRTPAERPSKEARKKFAGAFKDDPFLEKIVKDAYQERGRPIAEEDE